MLYLPCNCPVLPCSDLYDAVFALICSDLYDAVFARQARAKVELSESVTERHANDVVQLLQVSQYEAGYEGGTGKGMSAV